MKEIALYIHIPFCKQKCFYCDFPSYSGKEKYMDDYVDALCKEINTVSNEDYIIKSIFIGGGTPSYMSEKNLEKILKIVKKLDLSEMIEFTVECNPGVLEKEKLHLMKKNGVNRLSFGLQTTKDKLLKEIGRIHTYNEFLGNYKLAKEIGFNNINVDLMFGLPNQSVQDWRESLEEITKLNPEHISAYSLIIEEGTVFNKLYIEDKLVLPTEDQEREMYLISKDILEKNQYSQYEISNYSKVNKECIHNKIYWETKEYIGVGVSAASYINKKRIKNINSIKKYIDRINEKDSVVEEIIENTKSDEIEEYVFMGLRMMKGISLTKFKERFGEDIHCIYKEIIDKNIKDELLEIDGEEMKLTEKGVELSNRVMSDFIL